MSRVLARIETPILVAGIETPILAASKDAWRDEDESRSWLCQDELDSLLISPPPFSGQLRASLSVLSAGGNGILEVKLNDFDEQPQVVAIHIGSHHIIEFYPALEEALDEFIFDEHADGEIEVEIEFEWREDSQDEWTRLEIKETHDDPQAD